MSDTRKKLIGLLDYVEQVVRLDERVAFRLSEYRLPDGTTFAVAKSDTQNLPGIRHDHRDDEGPVWLEVERLPRKEPPAPPADIAEWVIVPADPARLPEARAERLVTVTAAERDAALARGDVRPDDVLDAPRKRGEPENAPPRYDLKLRLEYRPEIATAINVWTAGPWTEWSTVELPRRRTIGLYQGLYKIFQLLEVGGTESPIELMWGIGVVNWQKDGRIVDRPLLERRVDIELDDKRGGLIRVRPTGADALSDLKPYEELGCTGLPILADLIRREIHRTGESEGISPFGRESFEPILSAASVHLDREGCYAPDTATASLDNLQPSRLTVTDKWVLFARPRSQHVVLQDIDRLRRATEDDESSIEGLPQRLVTEPSSEVRDGAWEPLSKSIGASDGGSEAPLRADDTLDVFFPKPFNDDQREIIRRLSRADGLVVQGPPGTGKTHTIANLICHAMATGQRVLVVSRGEAALAVLKEQLPKEVQPLAIAVLSNEREGLRQIENAIREIQSVVEGTQPQNRRATIARLEKELEGLRKRVAEIDQELDAIALAHLEKIGPRGEIPAELAQRIVAERDAFRWFVDRPLRFVSDTSLEEQDVAALFEARVHCGELIDHLTTDLPSPLDLPDADTIARWHDDLIAAAAQGQVAAQGPARTLRITAENAVNAQGVAQTLDDLVRAHQAAMSARWIDPFRRTVIKGDANPWCDRLRERVEEWAAVDAERAKLLRRSVELPDGLIDNADACEAIGRAAKGQKLWPLMALGKGAAKALVSAIKKVRSVRRDELNPNDLKARLIAHFENPMPELVEIEDALSVCESNFERDMMQRLLERGYRVQGQVGSIGYRIDMVVEGADRRRLAVECDGDRYHGPEQWRQDMRRQRVLERVGWRFWRCFASNFYRDPDGVFNELIEMLGRMGIEPIGKGETNRPERRFTEHRTIKPAAAEPPPAADAAGIDVSAVEIPTAVESTAVPTGIGLGDKVVLLFADDQKRMSVRLSEAGHDLEKGRLSIGSPLGMSVLGAEEGDEVDLPLENGRQRKVLIESIEKSPTSAGTALGTATSADDAAAFA